MKRLFLKLAALALTVCLLLSGAVFAEEAAEPTETPAEIAEMPAVEPEAEAAPEAEPADEEADEEPEIAAEEGEEAPAEGPAEEAPAPEAEAIGALETTEETPEAEEPAEEDASNAEEAPPEDVTPIEEPGEAPGETVEAEEAPEEVLDADDEAEEIAGEAELAVPAGLVIEGGLVKAYTGSAASLVIPDGVTEIGESAFSMCKSLVSVTLPDSLKIIGMGAFNGCTNLNSVNIPNGVTHIGVYAFDMCRGLESVAIPGGVTEIADRLFEDCTSLKSVSLPSGLTRIGSKAFHCCESLESISIPDSVETFEYETFAECSSLKSIKLPRGLTRIGLSTFKNCTSLKSISLPEGLEEIHNWSFYNCTSLLTLTIPKTVTQIGWNAFAQSGSLTLFVYPGTSGETYAIENARYYAYALVGAKPAVASAEASASTAEVKEPVAFTVETPAWAKFLALYTESGSKVKTWGMSGNSTVNGTSRAWTVQYAISSPGDRVLTFRCSYDGEYGEGKAITIKVNPLLPAVESAEAGVSSAVAKENVTFTVKTPSGANYLAMFSESGAKVKVWGKTGNSTVSGSTRTWTVQYAVGTPGNRVLTFKCASGSAYGEGKTVSLKVTAALPAVTSVTASPATVQAKQEVTFTVRTPSTAKFLAMYSENGSKVKVWTMTGNSTVSGTTRIWTVKYAIANKGSRVLTFKCSTNGTYGEGKTINITVK